MPSANDINSDEYVAKLLSEDARKSSIKYSSMGLSALLPKRPTNSAPKPNTRFLQNILRETDSHNAALKRKEELEARLRLQNIKKAKVYDGEADGRERKRRRVEDDKDTDSGDHKRRSRRPEEDDGRSGRFEGRRNRHFHRHRSTGDEYESYDEIKAKKARYERSSHYHRRGRSRSSSPEEERRHRRRRRSRSDSPTPDHKRSRRHESESARERRTHRIRRRRSSSSHFRTRTPSPTANKNRKTRPSHSDPRPSRTRSPSSTLSSSSSASDPLKSIVGPLPPPKSPTLTSRGRGAHHHPTNQIDTHFSPTYNPTLDLSPTSSPSSPSTKKATEKEKEDWDLALEALRDRAIWKQKGAERLRSAGFGEEEVRRWEESSFTAAGSGREKGAEDVKWKGKGEEREWDVGKVVRREDDGRGKEVVGLEAAWMRKGKGGGLAAEMRRALG